VLRCGPMLVNCVAYQDGKKLADIDKREISNYVSRPDCFVWVALKDPDDAELAEMQVLLRESLDHGAWGYSTGLEYAQEQGAPEDELTALARKAPRSL